MSRQYLVLVDKRDSEKFRRFKMGEFNTATQEVLNKHGQKFIWGFHKGQALSSWKSIRKNNYMFFSVPKNNFEITAKLAKKITNKNLGKILWPDSLDSQNITYFLLFDAISQTDLLFTQTLDGAVKKIKMPFPGIYELKKNFKASLNTPKSQFNPLIIPFTQRKPAQKKIFEVIRFLRDPKKVKKLKELYHNKCQICGYTLEYDKGKFYSEVHHYNPLKASAADEEDNMIVVCPNHHAEFDHNMIAIDHDGTTIIDRGGKKIAAIRFKNEHSLDVKNIESQLEGS